MNYKEILTKYKTIAVVGMSRNPAKAAGNVPAYLIEHGYDVIPVNPMATEIGGRTSYARLADVPGKIGIVDVFRPSEDALDVTRQAVERRLSIGDVDVIWLQLGIYNEEARQLAEANGIIFVQDRCIMVEHRMAMASI